jgi:dihydroxy-acid dehydratase
MQPPGELIKKGISELPCIGDGRQSGTSGSPSILNASPEAAAGGVLAYVQDGDILRVDLLKRRVDLKISDEELAKRKQQGAMKMPPSQTPWQEIFRKDTDQLSEGMVLKSAIKYQRIAETYGVPRDNH